MTQLIHLYSLQVTFQMGLENQIAVKELKWFSRGGPVRTNACEVLGGTEVDGSILFPFLIYEYGHRSESH